MLYQQRHLSLFFRPSVMHTLPWFYPNVVSPGIKTMKAFCHEVRFKFDDRSFMSLYRLDVSVSNKNKLVLLLCKQT